MEDIYSKNKTDKDFVKEIDIQNEILKKLIKKISEANEKDIELIEKEHEDFDSS